MITQDGNRIDIITAARIARERGAAEHARFYRGLYGGAVASVRRLFSAPEGRSAPCGHG